MSTRAELDGLARLVTVLVDGGEAPDVPVEPIRRHGLGPLAFAHGLVACRGDYAMASIRAEQQRAIAAEATAALEQAGIPVALLKGISYAGWLYADPGERPMSDVDLLVPVATHARAVTVLGRLGYWHAGPSVQRSPLHHAITLKRRHGSVDLHRSPTQLGRVEIDLDAVWRRTQPAPWIPGARRLERDDEVLFHFANMARHELAVPLLAYVDAGRLLRVVGEGGRPALQARAATWRFTRVLDAVLEVVEHVLGWRPQAARWWLPRRDEVLAGTGSARWVQISRKLLLVESPRALLGLGRAVADGWWVSRRERSSRRSPP